MDTLESEKDVSASILPGRLLDSIIFFTWCHNENDSNSAALS